MGKYHSLIFELPTSHDAMVISEVELVFVSTHNPYSSAQQVACGCGFELHACAGNSSGKSSASCGKDKQHQHVRISGLPPARKWKLQFTSLHSEDAKLAKLSMKGQK